MADRPPFSLAVVSRNSEDELPDMLASVRRELGNAVEVVIVDNSSADGSLAAVAESDPAAKVIALEDNIGFGPASNLGVEESEGEVVILLNPDTVLLDSSLAALAEHARERRELFGARLLNEDRTDQISAFPAPAGWEVAVSAFLPSGLIPGPVLRRCEPWRFAERLEVGWLSGACIAGRRDLLLELGPFDRSYPLYGEDTDLGVRARRAGVPSVFAPDIARVVHLGSRSGTKEFSDIGMSRKIAARKRLIEEHFGRARAVYDTSVHFVQHSLRWAMKTLLRRDPAADRAWLRAAVRGARDTGGPW